MDRNPYAAPKAELVESEPVVGPVKRPFLIWFTQGLLLVIAALFIVRGLRSFAELAAQAEMSKGFVAVALTMALAAPPAALFIALIKPRPWARWGSIVFATFLMVVGVLGTVVTPKTGATQAEQWGALFGSVLMAVFFVLYPIRLYFSAKVRAFFRLPKRT